MTSTSPQPSSLADDNARYYVFEENTLIYQQPGWFLYGCVASKIGGRNPKNGAICIIESDVNEGRLRDATLADFDAFRVIPPPAFRALTDMTGEAN